MQQVVKQLYRDWPFVRKSLKERGCNSKDAEDIFQEALLIFCTKMNDPSFHLEGDPIYFVRQTSIFLWFNQARKNQKNGFVELTIELPQFDDDFLAKEEKLSKIEHAILSIGKQCQDILHLFYGLKLSMEEIAKKVGLRSDKVVKAQKYRCIQKVKEQLQKTEL